MNKKDIIKELNELNDMIEWSMLPENKERLSVKKYDYIDTLLAQRVILKRLLGLI